MRVPEKSAIALGSAIALAVRPERITISAASDTRGDDGNRVRGVVEGIVFLGESTTYLIRAGTDQFRVKRFHEPDGERFRGGDEVTLSWSPADTNVFALDQSRKGAGD